jgi:hypothetical protein
MRICYFSVLRVEGFHKVDNAEDKEGDGAADSDYSLSV